MPNYPLTVYYVYGINSDTCILTFNSTATTIQEYITNIELLKVTDLLVREIKENKNQPLFYIYKDGTYSRKVILD